MDERGGPSGYGRNGYDPLPPQGVGYEPRNYGYQYWDQRKPTRGSPWAYYGSRDFYPHGSYRPDLRPEFRQYRGPRSRGNYRNSCRENSTERSRKSRPSSPVEGSEEFTMRKIEQTSAIIMRHLLSSEEIIAADKKDQKNSEPDKKSEKVPEKLMEKSTAITSTPKKTKPVRNQRKNSTKSNEESQSKDVPEYNIGEIYSKIMNHISNMKDGKKKNLINAEISGYDEAIRQIQRQKRLEISRALRNMCNSTDEGVTLESSNLINSIIPDVGIKIEDLPRDVIQALRNTLGMDEEDDSFFITTTACSDTNFENVKVKEEQQDEFSNLSEDPKLLLESEPSVLLLESEPAPDINSSKYNVTTPIADNNIISTSTQDVIDKSPPVQVKTENLEYNFEFGHLETTQIKSEPPDSYEISSQPIENITESNAPSNNCADERVPSNDRLLGNPIPEAGIFELDVKQYKNLMQENNVNITNSSNEVSQESSNSFQPNTEIKLENDSVHFDVTEVNISPIKSNKNFEGGSVNFDINEENVSPIKGNTNLKATQNLSIINTIEPAQNNNRINTSEICQPVKNGEKTNHVNMELDTFIANFKVKYGDCDTSDLSSVVNKMEFIDKCVDSLNVFRRSLFDRLVKINISNNQLQGESSECKKRKLDENNEGDVANNVLQITENNAKRKRNNSNNSNGSACNLVKPLEVQKSHDVNKSNESVENKIKRRRNSDNPNSSVLIKPLEVQKSHEVNKNNQGGRVGVDQINNVTNENKTQHTIILSENVEDLVKDKLYNIKFPVIKSQITQIKTEGVQIFLATGNGEIYIGNLITGKFSKIVQNGKGVVTCLNALGRKLYACFNSNLRIYSLVNLNLVQKIEVFPEDKIQCLDFNIQWGYLFLGCVNGTLVRISIEKGNIEFQDRSQNNIQVIKATQEGPRKVLIVGNRSAPICIRDALSGLILRQLTGNILTTTYSLVLHQNFVFCGTTTQSILVFNYQQGNLMKKLEVSSKGVSCMERYKNLLFAGTTNGSIYIYQLHDNISLVHREKLPGGSILCMAVLPRQIIVKTMTRPIFSFTMPEEVTRRISF